MGLAARGEAGATPLLSVSRSLSLPLPLSPALFSLLFSISSVSFVIQFAGFIYFAGVLT